jgi:hypothetical protein
LLDLFMKLTLILSLQQQHKLRILLMLMV